MQFPFSDPLGEYVWNDRQTDLPFGVESIWIYGGPAAELSAQRLTAHWKACLAISREWDADGHLLACDMKILGPVTTPRKNGGCQRVEIVAARLFPEFATTSLGVAVSDIADQDVPLPRKLQCLAESLLKLAELSDVPSSTLANGLLHFIAEVLGTAKQSRAPIVDAARLIRASNGTMRLPALLSELAVSERSLRRQAMDNLGVSLKSYAGMVRHQALILRSLRQPTPNWSGLAAEFAYSDQAHLIRETKRYSGVTPARLHAERVFAQRIKQIPA